MWGKHLIIDMSAGDRERVQSAQHISRFAETLVETIGMKAYGAPLLEHFAEHLPEAAGYSLVQLIETSAITGHFCDRSGDAYIDIFSCKDFDAELAVEVVRAAFRPQHINFITLVRQAVTPRASYMLAAEYVLNLTMFTGMVMAAALLFTVGGIFMKLSEGLTKFWPTVIVFALFVIGAALQTLAMKREDLAVTYLWVVGLESILAFAFGVLLFSESCTPARIAGGIISLRSAY